MPACSWAKPASRSALAALNWIVVSWRSVRRSASSRLTPSAAKLMIGAASTGCAPVLGRRASSVAAPVGRRGGWLAGVCEFEGGGCRRTAWACAVVTPARITADTGPMTPNDATRTPRHAAPHNETPHCDPTGTSPIGVRAVRPVELAGWLIATLNAKSPRPERAGHGDRCARAGEDAGDMRRERPLSGGILPELPEVIGGCSDGLHGPLVLSVGGMSGGVSPREMPCRAIASGTPVC